MSKGMEIPWKLGDALRGVAVVVLGGAGVLILAVVLELIGFTGSAGASLLAGAMLEGLMLLAAWTFSVRRHHCSL